MGWDRFSCTAGTGSPQLDVQPYSDTLVSGIPGDITDDLALETVLTCREL